jgi:hypothetical protein
MSAPQRVVLFAAWAIWDGSEECRLAECLAQVGGDPIAELRRIVSEPIDGSQHREKGE